MISSLHVATNYEIQKSFEKLTLVKTFRVFAFPAAFKLHCIVLKPDLNDISMVLDIHG